MTREREIEIEIEHRLTLGIKLNSPSIILGLEEFIALVFEALGLLSCTGYRT
jgi:hypothetical protein